MLRFALNNLDCGRNKHLTNKQAEDAAAQAKSATNEADSHRAMLNARAAATTATRSAAKVVDMKETREDSPEEAMRDAAMQAMRNAAMQEAIKRRAETRAAAEVVDMKVASEDDFPDEAMRDAAMQEAILEPRGRYVLPLVGFF